MTLSRTVAVPFLLTAFAASSFAMGRSQPSDSQTAQPEKVSTFGAANPDDSGLSHRATDGAARQDSGGAGTSGSGTDTEVGPIGNNGAVQGANTGPNRVMGTGGTDPTQPTGEPGLPAEPVAPTGNDASQSQSR